MSTLEVSYWLRIPEALRPEPAGRPMLDPLWPVRGKIRPNGCPAIRSANQLGILLFTHHRLTFEGPRDFSLEIIAMEDQTLLCVPGVVGSLDSSLLFAKVDVGISVLKLPGPFLCTSVLDLDASYGLIVPSVLYPKGFTGPLLVPVASRAECKLESGFPVAQFIPLSAASELTIRDLGNSPLAGEDDSFEGLLLPGWNSPDCQRRQIRASGFLELAAAYTETELPRRIFHEST